MTVAASRTTAATALTDGAADSSDAVAPSLMTASSSDSYSPRGLRPRVRRVPIEVDVKRCWISRIPQLIKRGVQLEICIRAGGFNVDDLDVLCAEKHLPRRQRSGHVPSLLGLQVGDVCRAFERCGGDRDRNAEVSAFQPNVDYERVRCLVTARVPGDVLIVVLTRRRAPGTDEVELVQRFTL